MPNPPGLFLSYARIDDEDGRLIELLAKLQLEVRQQTGRDFSVFQDRQNIQWGQAWRSRIEEGLDESTFMLAVLSPSFFASESCREEVARFVENERRMDRDDLLLPIYYIEHGPLSRGGDGSPDEVIQAMTSHQYVDWRELRHEPLTLPTMSRRIADLGSQIRDAIERVAPIGGGPRAPASESSASAPDASSKPNEGTWFERPEPPTHIVDYTGRGQHLTIGEAIEDAAAGDRIIVRQGIYREALVMTKPLEIVGAGDGRETVIETRDADVVLFASSWGRLANLTLRQMGSTSIVYGIDITQGRLDVENCDITSRSGACIGIHDEADPHIRRNRVHDGSAGGVYVYDGGRGTIEDNDISGHAAAGVEVRNGGDPTIRANRIRDGRASGVFVHDGGRGTIEDNDISGNAIAGVGIAQGGDPWIRSNRIRHGKQAGVHVYREGRGTIEDNDITGNALAGVEVKEGADPTVRANRIGDNEGDGVYVHDNGRGTFEDNIVSGNAGEPFSIDDSSTPEIGPGQTA